MGFRVSLGIILLYLAGNSAIDICFRTSATVIALAKRARESGIDEGDVPMFLRKHLG